MTKAQLRTLESTLEFLNGSISYLTKDYIFICSNQLPTAKSFYNSEGMGLTPLQKFAGSELAYMLNAKEKLRMLIQEERERQAKKKNTN